jgi:hypothetical protein
MSKLLKRWGNGEEFPEEFSRERSSFSLHVRTGNVTAVRTFLESQPKWLWYYYCGESLLHLAAKYDHPEIIAVLVELGLDVNTPEEKYPWGPLNRTVNRGYFRSAQWLLEHGAKTTCQHRGLTFSCGLLSAVAEGNLEMVKLFVEHDAPLDILTDDPPRSHLTTAMQFGQKAVADYLRSKGALTEEEIKARMKDKPTSATGKKKKK